MEPKKKDGLSNKAKYFWISVFFIGSIGIWLPIIIEGVSPDGVKFHSIAPNVATYYVAILFGGSIDYFINKIKQGKSQGLISSFLNTILAIIFSFTTVIIITYLHIKTYDGWAFAISILGVLASWIMWWEANEDNKNFDDSDSELGGNPLKPLHSVI